MLMGFSKADFNRINHELLVAKLYAHGFSEDVMKLIFSYVTQSAKKPD